MVRRITMGSEPTLSNIPPQVEIHITTIGGDLAVVGRAANEIRARGDGPQLSLENDGNGVLVSCGGDCTLRVPDDASLVIDTVGGDVNITDISGSVTLN